MLPEHLRVVPGRTSPCEFARRRQAATSPGTHFPDRDYTEPPGATVRYAAVNAGSCGKCLWIVTGLGKNLTKLSLCCDNPTDSWL